MPIVSTLSRDDSLHNVIENLRDSIKNISACKGLHRELLDILIEVGIAEADAKWSEERIIGAIRATLKLSKVNLVATSRELMGKNNGDKEDS